MSSFMVELWESIFVPGPTPVILRATNATFAALQITLFALLVSTYSIHFAILSVLSAGLWWSINWFAAELAAAQARGDIPAGDGAGGGRPTLAADDKRVTGQTTTATMVAVGEGAAPPAALKENSDEDTEVESQSKQRGRKSKKKSKGNAASVAKSSADVEAVETKGELKHRVASLSDSTGFTSQSSVSTEDEWEKVSENENDKTK